MYFVRGSGPELYLNMGIPGPLNSQFPGPLNRIVLFYVYTTLQSTISYILFYFKILYCVL